MSMTIASARLVLLNFILYSSYAKVRFGPGGILREMARPVQAEERVNP